MAKKIFLERYELDDKFWGSGKTETIAIEKYDNGNPKVIATVLENAHWHSRDNYWIPQLKELVVKELDKKGNVIVERVNLNKEHVDRIFKNDTKIGSGNCLYREFDKRGNITLEVLQNKINDSKIEYRHISFENNKNNRITTELIISKSKIKNPETNQVEQKLSEIVKIVENRDLKEGRIKAESFVCPISLNDEFKNKIDTLDMKNNYKFFDEIKDLEFKAVEQKIEKSEMNIYVLKDGFNLKFDVNGDKIKTGEEKLFELKREFEEKYGDKFNPGLVDTSNIGKVTDAKIENLATALETVMKYENVCALDPRRDVVVDYLSFEKNDCNLCVTIENAINNVDSTSFNHDVSNGIISKIEVLDDLGDVIVGIKSKTDVLTVMPLEDKGDLSMSIAKCVIDSHEKVELYDFDNDNLSVDDFVDKMDNEGLIDKDLLPEYETPDIEASIDNDDIE